jgi:hypothetical protein
MKRKVPMSLASIWSAIAAAKTAIITGCVVFGLTLPLGYYKGSSDANARHQAARELANAKALQMDAAAGILASEERVVDALTVNENEEALIDAISTIPDTTPGAIRVAAGCRRLRAQGTAEADIPLVCGPSGGDRP